MLRRIRAHVRANVVGAVFLAAGLCGLALPAGASAFVYWANYTASTIGRANLDGTAANQGFIAGADHPRGVAVDGQHVYWDNYTTGTIGRSNLDGTAADQSFIVGASFPVGVTVDGQHVYWANSGADTIGRANLDGTGADESFIAGASGPEGISVDGQYVYWANYTTGTIGRASLNGAGADQNFITGADHPDGLAVDTQYVYWPNSNASTIGRANLNGTGADQSFISSASSPGGVATDSQHVYWANAGTGIARANLDGTGAQLSFIAGTSGDPIGVAVDSLNLTQPPLPLTEPTLTVAKTGSGAGSVISSDGEINCGLSCSRAYVDGASVTLTGSPASGSSFAGWSGGGCSGTASCTVTMSADRSVTAVFSANPPTRPSPPNTKIAKAKINPSKGLATFTFTASGEKTGFQCALVTKHKKARFRHCSSPKTYKRLKPGNYTFEVRAVGAGGPDPSPAKKKFKSRYG
jgi:hypothetical protein